MEVLTLHIIIYKAGNVLHNFDKIPYKILKKYDDILQYKRVEMWKTMQMTDGFIWHPQSKFALIGTPFQFSFSSAFKF